MNLKQQVRKIEIDLTNNIKKLLSPTKKNIVIFLPLGTYYKQLGNLPKKLSQKHNVVLAKTTPMPIDFESQFSSNISVGWLVRTTDGEMPIHIDWFERN